MAGINIRKSAVLPQWVRFAGKGCAARAYPPDAIILLKLGISCFPMKLSTVLHRM
jgi:hypothetical protein